MVSERHIQYLQYLKKKLEDEYQITKKGGSDWRRGNVLGKIEITNKLLAMLKCESLINRR